MKIPEILQEEYKRTVEIFDSYIKWMLFCVQDTGRDPNYFNNHLLSVLAQDYLETLWSTPILIKEGIHRPIIREARFLLEMSIKMTYIQQKDYNLSISEKLNKYKKTLQSPGISIMRDINLNLLDESLHTTFLKDSGRLYGYSSNYIHLTNDQISKRMKLLNNGRSMGRESDIDLKELNDFLEKIYSISIVYIMHCIPQHVPGDWLVEGDGRTIDWYFVKSKYISAIDELFDYKHERQEKIEKIKEKREKNIAF